MHLNVRYKFLLLLLVCVSMFFGGEGEVGCLWSMIYSAIGHPTLVPTFSVDVFTWPPVPPLPLPQPGLITVAIATLVHSIHTHTHTHTHKQHPLPSTPLVLKGTQSGYVECSCVILFVPVCGKPDKLPRPFPHWKSGNQCPGDEVTSGMRGPLRT